ncbi:hypothetical protein IC582_030072 [Cucumis melo]
MLHILLLQFIGRRRGILHLHTAAARKLQCRDRKWKTNTGKPEVSHVCGHYPPRPTYPNASNSKASFFLCFSLNFFFSFLSFSDIFLFSSFPLKFEFLCFLLLRPFPHA